MEDQPGMSVVVSIPNYQDIYFGLYDQLQSRIEAALSIGPEVPTLIKQQALLENRDMNGELIPLKGPRPKLNPTNNPEIPLVDTGNMMDPARWSVERTGDAEITVTYSPPDYIDYLVLTRPWISPDKINEDALFEIQTEMAARFARG
jgi:hypothetical protein